MELFDKVDKVEYQGVTLTNILRRLKPIKRILDRIDVYYDYTIKDGERPDTIAYDYYGSETYAWLVMITNNIYDPYYQWPLTSKQMFDFLTRKYGDYYQTQVDIAFYRHPDKTWTVTPYTFSQWSQEEQFGWRPVTIFESEEEINEKKRNIKLISNRYIDQIDREVNAYFNN